MADAARRWLAGQEERWGEPLARLMGDLVADAADYAAVWARRQEFNAGQLCEADPLAGGATNGFRRVCEAAKMRCARPAPLATPHPPLPSLSLLPRSRPAANHITASS